MINVLRLALFLFLSLIIPSSANAEIVTKTLDSGWTFTPKNQIESIPVKAGSYLETQLKREKCCTGEYSLTIETGFLKNITDGERNELAVFFPTIGGLKSIFINGQKTSLPKYDYSSIGPIIPLSESTIDLDSLRIKVEIESDLTTFSGMWKDAPKIGNILLLQKGRDSLYTYQKIVPTIFYIVFFGMGMMFLLVQKKSIIKNPIYKEYTFGFFFFGIHFLFLSGQMRALFPKMGGMLHYPSATLAWLSALRITANYAELNSKKILQLSKLVGFLFVAQLAVLFWGNTIPLHVGILVFVSLTNICIAFLIKKKDNIWTNLLFFSSLINAIGLLIDSFHLLFHIFSLTFPIIFLNRITTPPFLFMAIASLVRDLLKEITRSEKSKAIEEISLQVSHDLRSPLGTLEIVSNSLAEISSEKRLILRKAINRIRDISNSLLEKNRINGNADFFQNKELESYPSDSSTSIDLVINSLISEKTAQHRENEKLQFHYIRGNSNLNFFTKIDAAQFQRALSNLIDNSVESFIDGKGSVEISTRLISDNKIEVIIQDNGRGIPTHILPKLGTRGETFNKPNGSGLGLYQAIQTMISASGTLIVSSQENKGTKISLKLLLSQPPKWFLGRVQIVSQQHIVIVDDDTFIHSLWKERFSNTLSDLNQIHFFTSPQEFIKFYSRNFSELNPVTFLIDYEFSNSTETGLQIINNLGIKDQSILVTNHDEDPRLLNQCIEMGLHLLPKRWVEVVPIDVD